MFFAEQIITTRQNIELMTTKKSKTSIQEAYLPVKTILISQPVPSRGNPYLDLEKTYSLKIDYRPFIHVEGLSAKDFRNQRVYIDQYTAFVFLSRKAIENFFRLVKEMRLKIDPEWKYFCSSDAVASYLKKFIKFRKRKVFAGERSIRDVEKYIIRHKDEKFLFPASNITSDNIPNYFKDLGVELETSIMYKSVSSDLSDLRDIFYNVLVFYSPLELESLYENFPDFEQNKTRIATFGEKTKAAAEKKGLKVNIPAPTPKFRSMTAAIEDYIKKTL